jgi:phosphoglycolate phosphatase
MALFKGYFFDLDGTLIDTASSFEKILFELEWIKTPLDSTAQFLCGVDTRALIDYLLGHDIGDTKDHHRLFINHYEHHLDKFVIFYPDAIKLLETIKASKITVGIISNKDDPLCQKIAKIFELDLDLVLGSGVLKYKKPHPAPLLHAALKLNLHPHDCLYVGDMPTDLRAADLALMHSLFASYGCYLQFDPHFHYRNEIKQLKDMLGIFKTYS